MPSEVSPRIFDFLILSPPGSSAPTSASGTFIPAFTFGAPHTTLSGAPSPASTTQSESLSASGWRWTSSTWPTTTFG